MKIGIECGGTFTDIVLVDDSGDLVATNKVFSTPHDPSEAVAEGLRQLPVEHLAGAMLLHGSTVATNALIERKGARTGLITTRGFKDLLFLQRQDRRSMYDLTLVKPEPIVAREDIVEVVERVDSSGRVVVSLDTDSAIAAITALQEAGVEAIAVGLLHAYANPVHERELLALLRHHAPGVDVTLSSESNCEFREYERISTTTIDAFLRPHVSGYLTTLDGRAADCGIAELRVMQSDGGVVPARTAARTPLSMLRSGPAAGVAGANAAAQKAGYERIVTMDMGGTSTDVTLIVDGRPELTTETEADGLPVKVPMVDIVAVGAGGGSLVDIDSGGLLTVGPRSAGADPGPVCYGRGGTQATVTDANVVRGLIRPEAFLGGRTALDVEAARGSLQVAADALGTTVDSLAEDVCRLANVNMAGAIRMATTERGFDVRSFVLFAYGGAGPLHAASVADELGIRTVVIPPHNGLASAYGLLTAGFRREFSRTVLTDLTALGARDFRSLAHQMESEAREALHAERIETDRVVFEFSADMRYRGQGFELRVDLGTDLVGVDLAQAFNSTQLRRYGYLDHDKPVQLVTLRITATIPPEGVALPRVAAIPPGTTRHATIRENGREVVAEFVDRGALPTDTTTVGPTIIADTTSTTVVPTGWSAHVDVHTNLVLERTH